MARNIVRLDQPGASQKIYNFCRDAIWEHLISQSFAYAYANGSKMELVNLSQGEEKGEKKASW